MYFRKRDFPVIHSINPAFSELDQKTKKKFSRRDFFEVPVPLYQIFKFL